jgi:hypothetical protein
MKFGEWLAIISISTGASILFTATIAFLINNFQIIENPFQAMPSNGYYVSQETSAGEGERLGRSQYILRDVQEGIELYSVPEKDKITYYVYNETLNPVCVYSEMVSEENTSSSIFFSVPVYPLDDRQIGIIHLIPDVEPSYTFNWYVTGNPNRCGETEV